MMYNCIVGTSLQKIFRVSYGRSLQMMSNFFSTYPSPEEFTMDPQQGMPQTTPSVIRSSISSNYFMIPENTPR